MVLLETCGPEVLPHLAAAPHPTPGASAAPQLAAPHFHAQASATTSSQQQQQQQQHQYPQRQKACLNIAPVSPAPSPQPGWGPRLSWQVAGAAPGAGAGAAAGPDACPCTPVDRVMTTVAATAMNISPLPLRLQAAAAATAAAPVAAPAAAAAAAAVPPTMPGRLGLGVGQAVPGSMVFTTQGTKVSSKGHSVKIEILEHGSINRDSQTGSGWHACTHVQSMACEELVLAALDIIGTFPEDVTAHPGDRGLGGGSEQVWGAPYPTALGPGGGRGGPGQGWRPSPSNPSGQPSAQPGRGAARASARKESGAQARARGRREGEHLQVRGRVQAGLESVLPLVARMAVKAPPGSTLAEAALGALARVSAQPWGAQRVR